MNIQKRFEDAINSFVDKIKTDPKIVAVIVCGSFANDTVWEKSDMDTYVLVRDPKISIGSFCIEENGVIININLLTEFDFKRRMEKSLGGGWENSMFMQAKIVHTKDDTLYDFMKEVQKMGKDDIALAFLQAASGLIYYMEKIEKWLTVKNDPQYARLWVLNSASLYADMQLILDNKPSSRESVLKLTEYAPKLIEPVYQRPLSGHMTSDEIKDVLKFYKNFLEDNINLLKKPIEDYMSDGKVRTVTSLTKHFRMDSHGIYHIFDFLDEMGIVARVTETVRITPKSRRAVDEVAFMYIGGADDPQNY